jgi:hypothetical protein
MRSSTQIVSVSALLYCPIPINRARCGSIQMVVQMERRQRCSVFGSLRLTQVGSSAFASSRVPKTLCLRYSSALKDLVRSFRTRVPPARLKRWGIRVAYTSAASPLAIRDIASPPELLRLHRARTGADGEMKIAYTRKKQHNRPVIFIAKAAMPCLTSQTTDILECHNGKIFDSRTG